MPYIPSEKRREEIDEVVRQAVRINLTPNGDLNYFLFKLFLETVEQSYNNDKNFIAELTECGAEIRRRYLSPYEDGKILKNGDVKKWAQKPEETTQ